VPSPRSVRSELLRSRPLADRLSQAVIDRLTRFGPARRLVAYGLLVGLLLVSLGVLILLNLAVRRLWGELVYAVVVMAVAVWALGQTRVAREALAHFQVQPFSIKRAALWSAFALVAIPVAIVHWPWGPLVLAVGPVLAGAAYLTRKPGDPPWWRTPWLGAVGGIALVLATATVQPRFSAARASEQPPGAVAERAEERALAQRIRPLLLFDEVEQRFPVDVGAVMVRGDVQACREALGADPCDPVRRPEELDLAADYLAFEDVRGARGGGEASAYYYRLIARPGRLYVDYWWFFTRNPTPVAAGVFCAPGFRLPGKTCHEHASDWEGVTVVLGPCTSDSARCTPGPDGGRWAPIAVRYGQHEFLVSYPWATLIRLWRDVERPDPLRPVVFVARDSHASYPSRCRRRCTQFRSLLGRPVREGTHDGATPWRWNGADCGDCLQRLPLAGDGAPAEWNAFKGRWGDQHCLLSGAYCDATGAPRAPPQQGRYKRPWRPGPWLCLAEPERQQSRALRRCARSLSPEGALP
jgi:hypothetical protein